MKKKIIIGVVLILLGTTVTIYALNTNKNDEQSPYCKCIASCDAACPAHGEETCNCENLKESESYSCPAETVADPC